MISTEWVTAVAIPDARVSYEMGLLLCSLPLFAQVAGRNALLAAAAKDAVPCGKARRRATKTPVPKHNACMNIAYRGDGLGRCCQAAYCASHRHRTASCVVKRRQPLFAFFEL